ncbi:hypothetical protein Dimus_036231 [Dionaea muscipula]
MVKSSVKGISIEFDHEQCVAILDVLEEAGMREYIKDVWEESRYTKPLDITRRIANDESITAARRVKSMIDEATVEGESGSGEKFYDAEEEAQGSPDLHDEIPVEAPLSSTRAEGRGHSESRPLESLRERKLNLRNSSEFERKRANRFHDDLEGQS